MVAGSAGVAVVGAGVASGAGAPSSRAAVWAASLRRRSKSALRPVVGRPRAPSSRSNSATFIADISSSEGKGVLVVAGSAGVVAVWAAASPDTASAPRWRLERRPAPEVGATEGADACTGSGDSIAASLGVGTARLARRDRFAGGAASS